MSILKVARMGNPILRKKARAVDRRELKSLNLQRLIDDMLQTMVEYHGAGLAAPQVHFDLRLFVAITDPEHDSEPMVFVNPEITNRSDEIVEDWEGCLSIPDVRGKVPRSREIRARALNRNGDPMALDARDFGARVIQHEYDHIDGILFVDRMRSLDSLAFVNIASTIAPAF